MNATYSQGADALYIYIRDRREGEKVARTVAVGSGVQVDLDAAGDPIGFEVLWASERYPLADLATLPAPGGFLTLSQAAEIAGLSPQTLRIQAGAGRLRAEKRGRDWFTTRAWLNEYLAGRKHRGPRSARAGA